MADAGGIAMKTVAVSVVVMIVAAIIAVTMAPPPVTNPDIASNVGLNEGDTFTYSVTGTFNGNPVQGVLNASFIQGSWATNPIHTNNHTLNVMVGSWSRSYNSGVDAVRFATPFGVKETVWTFDFSFIGGGVGLATICYIGINPNVAYGYVLNAPSLHLVIRLDQTNNTMAKSGNTDAVTWHNLNISPKFPIEGGSILNASWGTHSQRFYTTSGGHMFFNITEDKVDICAFTEANMRSMAEGGPFACSLAISRVGAGPESGDALVPPGAFLVGMATHGSIEGTYSYVVV